MTTDKKTLDMYFTKRTRLEANKNELKNNFEAVLDRVYKKISDNNQKLYPAAAEYVLEVLADSAVREKYGRRSPPMTEEEIIYEVQGKEPRFIGPDVIRGLHILLSESPPKIEQRERTKTHSTAGYRKITMIYMLKENEESKK